jgi:hypothetical protein
VSLLRRAAGDEVHHASERRGAVERRGHALDDLHLGQVHGGNLQEADRPRLSAVEREAVGQDLRVATAQALDAYVGGAERGGRHLHAQPARLVEEHRDVARRHEQLLLDLLAVEDLHPHRLVLEPPAAAGGGDDHLLGQLEMRPQLHDDAGLVAGPQGHLRRLRLHAFRADLDLHGCIGDSEYGPPLAIRRGRVRTDTHRRIAYRFAFVHDLDPHMGDVFGVDGKTPCCPQHRCAHPHGSAHAPHLSSLMSDGMLLGLCRATWTR